MEIEIGRPRSLTALGTAAAWPFAAPLLAIAIIFFGAARFLPPVDTGGESIAVLVGYTNRLIPLIAILSAGAVAVGTFCFMIARNDAIALQAGMLSHTSWRTKYRHIVAACLLCVFAIATYPAWSNEYGFFGQRLTMMTDGLRPYTDFEYPYGYIVAHLPYALHLAGLSIPASLIIALCLFAVMGIVSFAVILERNVSDPSCRAVLFWSLVACETFVEPGPSLNYNFGRYAMPFAILSLLTEKLTALNIVQIFAAFAGAVVFLDFVSPEIAFGFSAALLAWVAVVARQISLGKVAAGVLGVLAGAIGTPLVVPDMFVSFNSYAQVQVLMPVVPNIIMALVILSFLSIGTINFAVALSIWSGKRSRHLALQLSLPTAYALLSAGLLPAVVGRSWPTITIAYGFVPIVMSIGYLIQSGRKRTAWAVTSVFAVFVAYSAQFEMENMARAVFHRLKTACAGLHVSLCTEERQPPSVRTDRLLARTAAVEFLRANYPASYDPLAILGAPQRGVSNVGYYVGLQDIPTQQGLDRKAAELDQATTYILPANKERIRVGPRSLTEFARAGLYPLALLAVPSDARFKSSFVAMLYEKCRSVAAFGDIVAATNRRSCRAGTETRIAMRFCLPPLRWR